MTGALLALGNAEAAALSVYGQPQALGGAGGCLHDPSRELALCAGVAEGLAGASAVAVSPDGTNAYVAAGSDVLALARNRATGTLRPARSPSAQACVGTSLAGACAASDSALGGADALAISPDGRFVYVGAANSASVSAFARGPHGVLAPLAGSYGAGRRRAKKWFGCVLGAPLAGFPHHECQAQYEPLNALSALAISPDGRFLYALSTGLEPGEDSLVTLQRDPHGGGLRPLPGNRGCLQSLPGDGCRALAGLEGASAIALSGDGRFLYVASAVSGAVRGFAVNRSTGVLTPLFGPGGCVSSGQKASHDVPCESTVPQLAGARSLALSPDGRELYVAAFDPGAVVVLDRDPISGTLAPASPPVPNCLQAAAAEPTCPSGKSFLRGAAAIAMGPRGSVVYVVSEAGNSLLELARDPTDGVLTPISETPTDLDGLNGPAALALSAGGEDLYVVSPFDDGVAGFALG